MAKIKGTNGDDNLVGTSGNDTILSLLGMDSVDGGAGYDVLTIDYSAINSSVFPGSMKLAADATWTGGVSCGVNGGPVNVTAFENVERILYTASGDVDYLSVDLGTLALDRTRLNLDGAGGDDILALNASQVATSTALTLAVAGDGTIKSNAAVLAGWEAFDIALNAASGNKVTLGAGDDIVRSSGGRDTIDLGAGDDLWQSDYSARTDALTVSASAANGIGVVSGSTTISQVKNAERMYLTLGAGNDLAYLGDATGSISGGGGTDNRLFTSVASAPLSVTLDTAGDGSLGGALAEKTAPTPLSFSAFRVVYLGASNGNDSFHVDAATRAIADKNYLMILDGFGGTDDLTLDLRAEGQAGLFREAAGISFGGLSIAGKSNSIEFRNIENLTVLFGAGNDTVDAGLATTMVVDGGAGTDTIDFAAATAAVTIDLGYAGAQTVAGLSVTLTHVEGINGSAYDDRLYAGPTGSVISGGNGNDWIYSDSAGAAGADVFAGGAGTDRVDYSAAASGVTVSLALTVAQSTGGGGTDTLSGIEDLVGSNFADTLTGSDAANFLYGGLGKDLIEGLAGDDILYGNDGIDTVSYAHAATAVTVSLATNAQQDTKGAGKDILYGFEDLTGSANGDTLTGSTGSNAITGGLGTDIMTGNGGNDRFVFRTAAETSPAYLSGDLITDFVGFGRGGVGDVIDVSGIDAVSGTRGNDAFSFIGTGAFTGVAGQLRAFALGDGLFYVAGDTNGDKTADFGIYVQSTDTALLKADFVL